VICHSNKNASDVQIAGVFDVPNMKEKYAILVHKTRKFLLTLNIKRDIIKSYKWEGAKNEFFRS